MGLICTSDCWCLGLLFYFIYHARVETKLILLPWSVMIACMDGGDYELMGVN